MSEEKNPVSFQDLCVQVAENSVRIETLEKFIDRIDKKLWGLIVGVLLTLIAVIVKS